MKHSLRSIFVTCVFAGLLAPVVRSADAPAPAGRGAVRMTLPAGFIDKTPPGPATAGSGPMGRVLLLAGAPPAPDALVKAMEIIGVQAMVPENGGEFNDDSLHALADATQKEAQRGLDNAKVTDARDTTVGGAKAYRFTITGMKNNVTLRELNVLAVRNKVGYKIQYAAEASAFDKRAADIEKSIDSVQWVDEKAADNK